MAINLDKLKVNVLERIDLYSGFIRESHIEQIQELGINSDQYRTSDDINTLVQEIVNPDFSVIYKFDISSKQQKNDLIKAYEEFHEMNKTRKRGIDRLNVSRFNKTSSQTLYVGSKMKNLRSRVKQHLGYGHFRTFSLHLNKWDNALEYQIKLEIFKVSNDIDKLYQRVITEFFEQELWEQCQPIFGKKSGL